MMMLDVADWDRRDPSLAAQTYDPPAGFLGGNKLKGLGSGHELVP
jgi:hypothetical protein